MVKYVAVGGGCAMSWMLATFLDVMAYISGRRLHIWAMGVTYLADRYISGR